MPVATAIMLKHAYRLCMALGAMVVIAPAWAVTAPIYKCFDSQLNLVYTDLPCKEGEVVDIRAGSADPVAVARLERERDQLDQSAAQRMLDERRAALAPGYGTSPPQAPSPTEVAADTYGYGVGYIYPPVRRPPLHHRRPHPPHAVSGVVRAAPHIPRS